MTRQTRGQEPTGPDQGNVPVEPDQGPPTEEYPAPGAHPAAEAPAPESGQEPRVDGEQSYPFGSQ